MAIHITQIEKHRFVCGLFWQSLSRPRELAKEAADLAKKIDFDLMVLRTDQSTAQAGYAHTRDGVKRGMFSLGAIISKTLAVEGAFYDGEQQPVHNWLAALKLPDGKWAYFAVRDANFLPNGDFAGTKEEVLERLHGDYGLGGWNVVIGDEELADYGFHNFNPRTVESLIPHRRDGRIRVHRWWGMRQLNVRYNWWPVAAAAGVALVVGGVAWWQHYQKTQEALRLEEAIAAARQKMLMESPPPAPQPPAWEGVPRPLAVARACVDRLTYMAPGGWELESYECSPHQASYAWGRRYSTVGFLLAQVPAASVDINGEKASWSQPLDLEAPDAEALIGFRELLEPMLSRLQLMGVATRFASVPHQAGRDTPPPQWQTYSFMVETRGVAPTAVAAVLEQPGVRINKLAYRGGNWSIEGVMYAK